MYDAKDDPCYRRVELVVNAIADWIDRFRCWHTIGTKFSKFSPDEVAKMAQDLGISSHELEILASKGSDSAQLVEKLLRALGVEALAQEHEAVLLDLRRVCTFCNQKRRCAHDLASADIAERFRQYCPNALTLDALIAEKGAQHQRCPH